MAYKLTSPLNMGHLKLAITKIIRIIPKYGKATATSDGLMPKEDKAKVDNMPAKINGTALDGSEDFSVFAKIKVVSVDPTSPDVGDIWIKTS